MFKADYKALKSIQMGGGGAIPPIEVTNMTKSITIRPNQRDRGVALLSPNKDYLIQLNDLLFKQLGILSLKMEKKNIDEDWSKTPDGRTQYRIGLREDEIATVLQSIDDNKYNILANHIDTLFNNYKDYLIRKNEAYANHKENIAKWRITNYGKHFKNLWDYFYPKYTNYSPKKQSRALFDHWINFINYLFPKSLNIPAAVSASASGDVIPKDFTITDLDDAFLHCNDANFLIAELDD